MSNAATPITTEIRRTVRALNALADRYGNTSDYRFRVDLSTGEVDETPISSTGWFEDEPNIVYLRCHTGYKRWTYARMAESLETAALIARGA